jgi:hypothetical protein
LKRVVSWLAVVADAATDEVAVTAASTSMETR